VLVRASSELCEEGKLRWDASPQQLADRILARQAKDTDDALVLVVRYLGAGP
jgi:hypothetical protein